MSHKRNFRAGLCELAQAGTPEARTALEYILQEADRLLVLVHAKRYILEGWNNERQQLDGTE